MTSTSILSARNWERVKKGDFCVTLTLEILTYAQVYCVFLRFAGLEIPLLIRVTIVAPILFNYSPRDAAHFFSYFSLGHSDGDALCGWQTEDH